MKGKLNCPDGCGLKLQPKVIEFLEWLEKFVGKEMTVNSGARCPKYNAIVGGGKNSAHQLGLAVDIDLNDSSNFRYLVYKGIFKYEIKRIGQGKTFVHVDFAKGKLPDGSGEYPQGVMWTY